MMEEKELDEEERMTRPEYRGLKVKPVDGGYEVLRNGWHLTTIYPWNGILYELAETLYKATDGKKA